MLTGRVANAATSPRCEASIHSIAGGGRDEGRVTVGEGGMVNGGEDDGSPHEKSAGYRDDALMEESVWPPLLGKGFEVEVFCGIDNNVTQWLTALSSWRL